MAVADEWQGSKVAKTKSSKKVQCYCMTEIIPSPKRRDYVAERRAAREKKALRVASLADDRNTGKLGDEVIKIAQAMILCTLPYRATDKNKITRSARLGDGSILYVTFTAGMRDVPLPFGADRKLLAWIFDRAISSNSPFIPWNSAAEYQDEIGQSRGGKNNRELRERFRRISGLVISIERKTQTAQADQFFTVVEKSYLPASIKDDSDDDDALQQSLPELADRYGFVLTRMLFDDIRKHHVAVPRSLWLQNKGSSHVHDLLLWLYYRCYAAQSESVIPWDSLREMFPDDDSNDRRLRQNAEQAIKELRILWPTVRIDTVPEGVWVNRAAQGMLPDDVDRNRIRRT